MIILKSRQEIEAMRRASEIVADCHREIAKLIAPGITTLEINDFVANHIIKLGGKQFTKGYNGFPAETCASVNDVVAHGFPGRTPLKEGDIAKIDIVVECDGWFGDSAWCYEVGQVSEPAQKLMRVTRECLYLGIEQAVPAVVRDLLGHGIGRSLHEEPNYEHVGVAGKGIRLKEGMVFTVEPMINEGTHRISIDNDGWTARTADGKLSAQYEHTIAITADGPIILTEQ
ncbi:Methionine aminopeptidase 1 [compost metagenome]